MQDVNAIEKELALGLNSLTRIAAERGRTFDAILAERVEERRKLQEAGLLAASGESTDGNELARALLTKQVLEEE